jgi:hypothetical protein
MTEAPRSLVIRRACVVLGLLGLFLQGSAGGHVLLVEHAKCAEHGELIHGAQGHVNDTATESGNSLRSTSDPESEAAHDHCLLAADRRDAMKLVVEPQLTAVRKIEAPVRGEAADVTPPENAPRFHVAPKNSPPA